MRVLAKDGEIDDRTDEEYIYDQLRREPAKFAEGNKSLLLQFHKRSSYYLMSVALDGLG